MSEEMISAKELAAALDTDPKTARKFLRSLTADRAGKGGRWAINANDLPALRIRFEEFSNRKATMLIIPTED